jgi:phospholipid/cholesterol/gamma-HCH transport system substrate-binding protein
MKSSAIETLVGAAVIGAALLFFAFAYRTGGYGGPSGGYHVIAQFNNIDGVSVGTDVRVAGIKVGSVVSQSLDPKSYQARIDMILQPQVQLADDTSAKVSSEGLLGAKFIALEPGGSDTKLADGSEISYTQGAVDMWSLISQAMFSKPNGSKQQDAAPAGGGTGEAPKGQDPGATQNPQ